MTETALSIEKQVIGMTEVTLRDGMQQDNIMGGEAPTLEDRLDVFNSLVDAGMERIEIGHLGNEQGQDIAFAQQLVEFLTNAQKLGPNKYDNVELQVLLGSQKELVERGVAALDGLDKDRVIVHVYDRVSPNLRDLAAEPYSAHESAERIIEAAQIAREHGFTRFSISGEGAIDPMISIEDVTEFYEIVVDALFDSGATEVNCNLANTFGFSVGDETEAELAFFNDRVKQGRTNVTTSVHVHNDYNDAPGYALAAVRNGFDRIEGTMIGMGERAGNVAIADVLVRLLEDARTHIERMERGASTSQLGQLVTRESLWQTRQLERSVVAALHNIYDSCVYIADTFGVQNRFERTSLGNPEAYDAGSGPHAHANREFLRDPVRNPLWRNYGSVALVHAMLGRPEAQEIISVDVDRIRRITLATHAAGGSTRQVLNGDAVAAPPQERHKSSTIAHDRMDQIRHLITSTTTIDQQ